MFLKVLNGPHRDRVFDCSGGPLSYGRCMPPSRVLTVDEDVTARCSGWIERIRGVYVIEDHSENGIFVNDLFLHGSSTNLSPGDEIRVGRTRMVMLDDAEANGPGEGGTKVNLSSGSVEVDRAKLDQLARLFPSMSAADVVDFLVNKELYSRGHRDPLTGVGTRWELLRRVPRLPKDLPGAASSSLRFGDSPCGLDGEVKRWIVAADIRGLNRINDHGGMEAGDEALVFLAAAFRRGAQGAYIFRMHGDAFAAISDRELNFEGVQAEIEELFREELATSRHLQSLCSGVDVTFAHLQLVVARPFTAGIMGPLICDEIERALVVARMAETPIGVQHRRIDLNASLSQR